MRFYKSMLTEQQACEDDCYDLKKNFKHDAPNKAKVIVRGRDKQSTDNSKLKQLMGGSHRVKDMLDKTIEKISRPSSFLPTEVKPARDYLDFKRIDFSRLEGASPSKQSKHSCTRTGKNSHKDLFANSPLSKKPSYHRPKQLSILELRTCQNTYISNLIKQKKAAILNSFDSKPATKLLKENSDLVGQGQTELKKGMLKQKKRSLPKVESEARNNYSRKATPSSSRKRKPHNSPTTDRILGVPRTQLTSVDYEKCPFGNPQRRKNSKKRSNKSFQNNELRARILANRAAATSQPLNRNNSSKRMNSSEIDSQTANGEPHSRSRHLLAEVHTKKMRFGELDLMNLKNKIARQKDHSKEKKQKKSSVFKKMSTGGQLPSEFAQIFQQYKSLAGHQRFNHQLKFNGKNDSRKQGIKTSSKNSQLATMEAKKRTQTETLNFERPGKLSDFSFHKNKHGLLISSSLLMNNEKLEADLTDSNEILQENMGILNHHSRAEAGAEYRINSIMSDLTLTVESLKAKWEDIKFVLSQDYIILSYLNSFDTVLRIFRMIIMNFEDFRHLNFDLQRSRPVEKIEEQQISSLE